MNFKLFPLNFFIPAKVFLKYKIFSARYLKGSINSKLKIQNWFFPYQGKTSFIPVPLNQTPITVRITNEVTRNTKTACTIS